MVKEPFDENNTLNFGYKTEAFGNVDLTFSGIGYDAGNLEGYLRAGVQGGISYKGIASINLDEVTERLDKTNEKREPIMTGLDVGGNFNKVIPFVKPYIEGQANITLSRNSSLGLFARGEYTVPIQDKTINKEDNGYRLVGGIRLSLY